MIWPIFDAVNQHEPFAEILFDQFLLRFDISQRLLDLALILYRLLYTVPPL
jgi:hypothetical protein